MTDIKKLLIQKENRKLEFKRELPSNDKLIKTAIAFANSQGGDLIVGVEDDGKIIGVDENEIVLCEEKISSAIYDGCSPSIIPEIFEIGEFTSLANGEFTSLANTHCQHSSIQTC